MSKLPVDPYNRTYIVEAPLDNPDRAPLGGTGKDFVVTLSDNVETPGSDMMFLSRSGKWVPFTTTDLVTWGAITGDITEQADLMAMFAQYTPTSGYHIVAFTGDYNQLNNLPPLGTVSPLDLDGSTSRFLRGDGVWAIPVDVNAEWGNITGNINAQTDLIALLDLKAPITSPVFQGNPQAPTPPKDNNSKSIATTEWYFGQAFNGVPQMDGVGSSGNSTLWARGNHVHPSDDSKADSSALAGYLPLSGGTLTGALKLPNGVASAPSLNFAGSATTGLSYSAAAGLIFSQAGSNRLSITSSINAAVPVMLAADPTLPLQAATKQYVDARPTGIGDAPVDGQQYARKDAAWSVVTSSGGGGGGVWIGDAPPSNTTTYPFWWSSASLQLAIWYNDGNSSQWVDTNAQPSAATGPWLLQDGTVAAPGLSWASEPGLGWYRPSASSFYVAAAGQAVQYLDASVATNTTMGVWPRAAGGGGSLTAWNKTSAAANGNYLQMGIAPNGNGNVTVGAIGTATLGNLILDAPAVTATQALNVNGGQININGASAFVGLNKSASGGYSYLTGFTGGKTRWQFFLGDNTPESGGSAGSNFKLISFDDAGGYIGTPLTIVRNTGLITFGNNGSCFVELSKGALANYSSTLRGTVGSVPQWELHLGSINNNNFELARFNTAGTYLGSPFVIDQAQGNASFTGNVNANSGFWYNAASGVFGLTSNGWTSENPYQRVSMYNFSSVGDTITAVAYLQVGIASFVQYGVGGGGAWFRHNNNAEAYKSAGSSAWQVPSDAALKTDIQPYTQGLDAILQIEPVSYVRKTSLREGAFANEQKREIGITAQQIQVPMPETVSTSSDGLLMFDAGPITFALINAVKELNAKIEALQ